MGTVLDLQKRIAPLAKKQALEKIAFQELKKEKQFLIKLEKERLDKGQDTSGKVVGTYSESTEQIAKTQNPIKPKIAGQPFNFQYFGSFFRKMGMAFRSLTSVFTNTDTKAGILLSKYPNLLGVSDKDWADFLNTRLHTNFMKQFRKKSGL